MSLEQEDQKKKPRKQPTKLSDSESEGSDSDAGVEIEIIKKPRGRPRKKKEQENVQEQPPQLQSQYYSPAFHAPQAQRGSKSRAQAHQEPPQQAYFVPQPYPDDDYYAYIPEDVVAYLRQIQTDVKKIKTRQKGGKKAIKQKVSESQAPIIIQAPQQAQAPNPEPPPPKKDPEIEAVKRQMLVRF